MATKVMHDAPLENDADEEEEDAQVRQLAHANGNGSSLAAAWRDKKRKWSDNEEPDGEGDAVVETNNKSGFKRLRSAMDWMIEHENKLDDERLQHMRSYFKAIRQLYDAQFQLKRPSAILKMKSNPYGFKAGSTFDALSALLSPMRTPQVLDDWTAMEIGMFEEAFDRCGRNFHKIAEQIVTKSAKQVIAFYYVWKKHSAYALKKKAMEKHDDADDDDDDMVIDAMPEMESDTEPEILERVQRLRQKHLSMRDLLEAARAMYDPNPLLHCGYKSLNLKEFGLVRRSFLQPAVHGSSPLRSLSAINNWTPYEIRLFELAMECYGKEFHQVARVVQTKTCKQVIAFYYLWKKDPQYQLLKNRWEKKNTFLKKKKKKPESTSTTALTSN